MLRWRGALLSSLATADPGARWFSSEAMVRTRSIAAAARRYSPRWRRRHSTIPMSPQLQQDDDSSVASITVGMERALRDRRTDEAVRGFERLRLKGSFPSRDCISTLVAQLAYKQTPSSLSQADKLVQEIVAMSRTDLLDHNSLSLLALSYAGVGMSSFARATLKFMFQIKHYPSVKVWVAVVSKIAENRDEGPAALALFDEICKITGSLVESSSGKVREACSTSLGAPQTEDPVSRIMRLMDQAMTLKDDNVLLVQMKPDVAAFNAALKICASLGMAKEAEKVFETMNSYGVCPDNASFHWLIKVYGKAGLFDLFKEVPRRMEAASIKPSGTTLKALLEAYVDSGNLDEAEGLLKRSVGADSKSNAWRLLKLDDDVYNSLLKAYVSSQRLSDAADLLASLAEEDTGNGINQGKVVWSMVASGLMTEIYSVIQHMSFHKMPLHFASYRSIIQGFSSNNQLDKAAGVIILMKRAAVKPDASCYGPLIQGLVRCGDKLLACHTFQEMVEARIPADESIYIPLLKGLSVECQASRMLKVMYGLLDFNVKPNLYAWNLVIEALSKRRMVGDAKRLLLRMEPSGVPPDSYSFWYVVKGLITCSRLVEVLDIWPLVQRGISRDSERLQMHKELVDTLLYAFVKGAYFAHALEVLEYAQSEGIPLDKEAFRDLFLKYHSHRFTSKHKSPLRVYRRQQQVEEMEKFKQWLQLTPIKIPARYSEILRMGPY